MITATMSTISGHELKNEIIKSRLKGEECDALLAGFVRSCMSLSFSPSGFTLQLECRTESVREYIAGMMLRRYKVSPIKTSPSLDYADCEKLLRKLGVFEPNSDRYEVAPVPAMSEAGQSAYMRGVFLACGSFSARSAADGYAGGGGYHLEFSVLSESFADEIAALLASREVAVHKMVRAEKFVVYAKDSENVSNCLALMRLDRFVLDLNATMATLSVKRGINRMINCEMANLTRTANAAGNVLEAIERLRDAGEYEKLPTKLLEAADARANSPEGTICDLAYELGISKSGLKHRFDRIVAIADKLPKRRQR